MLINTGNISRKVLSKVLRSFVKNFERLQLYKCDKGRSEKGSGLGLSIVHQLVEKMGGNITVESVPGKGTKFMLLFPLEI